MGVAVIAVIMFVLNYNKSFSIDRSPSQSNRYIETTMTISSHNTHTYIYLIHVELVTKLGWLLLYLYRGLYFHN
jgi:hypothetical protein